MKSTWQLQEAKNKLSEVVNEAVAHGPQIISRRGVETAVVLGMQDYNKLTRKKESLAQFFQRSPLCGVELDLSREADTAREVSL